MEFIMPNQKTNITKILIILSFFCIVLTNLDIFLNPSTGYELSLYNSVNFFYWFFLFSSIALSLTVIFVEIYSNNFEKSNLWIIALAGLILARISVTLLPFSRGYFSWYYDHLDHIGYVKDIILDGHVGEYNFYPIPHVFSAQICMLLNLQEKDIVNLSPIIYALIYIIFIYYLSTMCFKDKKIQILSICAISCTLLNIYHAFYLPNGFSILLIPLYFYIFFLVFFHRNQNYKWLLLILLILIPFVHPLTVLILLLFFISFGIAHVLMIGYKFNYIFKENNFQLLPFYSAIFVGIIWFVWLFEINKFKGLNILLRHLINALITGDSPNTLVNFGETLEKMNLTGVNFLKLLSFKMGDELLFLLFFFVAVVIIVKTYKNINYNPENFILIFATILFGTIYAMYLFNMISGLNNISSQRLLNYVTIFTPIFIGFVISYSLKSKKTAMCIFWIILLTMTSAISVIGLFESPFTSRPNSQVTNMEINGAMWFIDYSKPSMGNTFFTTSPTFFYFDAIMGVDARRQKTLISEGDPQIPDHFGYSNKTYLGQLYDGDKYSFFSEKDKIVYSTVWKPVGRFDLSDFDKLNQDTSVNYLYNNGGSHLIYIKSM